MFGKNYEIGKGMSKETIGSGKYGVSQFKADNDCCETKTYEEKEGKRNLDFMVIIPPSPPSVPSLE